jgi:protein-L-isoaspartate(D-aspartate) O-methyltransferase
MRKSIRKRGGGDIAARIDALIQDLKRKNCLSSDRVESALRAVHRHQFLPDVSLEEAYSDRAIVTKQVAGKWVSSSSQPSMMAIMLEQLGLEPGQKVLEIGAGTGYNAALMAYLVGDTGQVITIDIAPDIVQQARRNLATAGVEGVQVICEDGGYGCAPAAPFDRIILTVGSKDISPYWWEQLKMGGRLILPIQIGSGQKSIAFERREDRLASLSIVDCGFMMLQGFFAEPPASQVELGPEPGLLLESDQPLPAEGSTLYGYLTGQSREWEVGVTITLQEFMRGLRFWLSLQEPGMTSLVAVGEMVDRRLAPALFGFRGEWKSTIAPVLCSTGGLAALVRHPGEDVPLVELQEWIGADAPFPLFIRQFGGDESLVQRLVRGIRDWDRAGRPDSTGLRVRVFPPDSTVQPGPGEYAVDKKWTRMILDWPKEAT